MYEEEYAVYEIVRDGVSSMVRFNSYSYMDATDDEKLLTKVFYDAGKPGDLWEPGINGDAFKLAERVFNEHFDSAKMVEKHYDSDAIGNVVY